MRRFFKGEKGNVAVLTALAMVGLLGITGLAVDGSMLYLQKSELQKVANAAVLSGAQELFTSKAKVEEIVGDILEKHGEEGSLDTIVVEENKKVRVVLKKNMNLTFAKVLGFENADVKAAATASTGTMGRATGAAPLGIHESFSPVYGETYQLKAGTTDSDTGWFGVLALDGPGAKTYEETFRQGFSEELETEDIVNTQTGNIAEPTRRVVQERINGCSSLPGDLLDRDCSRVILVPVYQEYPKGTTPNQVKQVKIVGFSYFYILEPMSNTDTSITGMFIKRADTGFFKEGSLDRGAYIVRLTE